MDREVLEAWLAEGRSIEWIARQVGKHPSTVSYWARKHGLESQHARKYAARGAIARDTLAGLVDEGLTVREIAAAVERSAATVRHWLREYGLRTAAAQRPVLEAVDEDGRRAGICPRHGETVFARRDSGWRCVRCRSDAVVARRRRVKDILVAEAGGACVLCGYDRSAAALQFHHVDAATKTFAIAARGVARSIERARAEVRKCVLVCANCHAEIEAGVAKLPAAAADYPS